MPSPLSVTLGATWAALHTLQYGLAISGLNGIQAPLTCGLASGGGAHFASDEPALKPCVPMSSAQFGLVVAIFTIGGLVGSLGSAPVVGRFGSVGTLRLSALFVLAGSCAVGLANSFIAMLLGRVLVGLGCGLATTTVPLYLAHLAPAAIKKSLGILNQLFIVFGILIGQSLAFPFAHPRVWRYVLAVAAGIAAVQLVGSVWAREHGDSKGDGADRGAEEDSPLLGEADRPLSLVEVVKTKDARVRRGLVLVVITQLAQQLCGISAVMYFSTSILTPVFKGNSKLVALAIVILKVPVTTTPAFLIERIGSRPLMLYPTIGIAAFSLMLAVGINTSAPALSAIGILGFVSAFSVGLGPVTWVVLSEVMPVPARPVASSLGLSINWLTNFIIGASFLPLQQKMAGGQPSGEGSIFYLFTATCLVAAVAINAGYRSLARVQLD